MEIRFRGTARTRTPQTAVRPFTPRSMAKIAQFGAGTRILKTSVRFVPHATLELELDVISSRSNSLTVLLLLLVLVCFVLGKRHEPR